MKAVIDVSEWQTVVDMENGYPFEGLFPYREQLQSIAGRYPYPGDQKNESIDWVFQLARECIPLNDPQWLCLNFTQPVFAGLYKPLDKAARDRGVEMIMNGVRQLAEEYGFKTVIVGSGLLTPHLGQVEFGPLDGVLQSTSWTNRWAGVYQASDRDMETVLAAPHISRIIRREEIEPHSDNVSFKSHLPDILLAAEPGWSLKGFASNNISLHNLEQPQATLPVYSQLGRSGHIEQVYSLMRDALHAGQKVLLAIVEGGGLEDIGGWQVDNQRDWYTYSSYLLYYTLVTGRSFYQFDLPPVFDMTRRADFPLRCPLSMQNARLCQESLARAADVRSLCIGCRSMVSHTIINADITAECYIRSLANMGILMAVND